MKRITSGDLAVPGLLAVAVIAFFWDAALFRGAFFVQDVMVQNYPFREFFAKALKSDWSLPLWHPGINCGFPLFAEGQAGILYPFNLLTSLLLPAFAGITINVLFHLWLGAAATYWYLRILKSAPSAAAVGAMTYGLSGFLVVRAMSQNYIDVSAWVPALFALFELALTRRKWGYVWAAAAVVGLQFLAGHPQATVYGVGAALLYATARGFELGSPRSIVVAMVVAVPLVGAGLAAVQIVPTLELVELSGRGEGLGFGEVANMSLPPERLVGFLLPNAFGNPAFGSYWGREAGFFIQLCPYIGVLPLLLATIALRERRDGVTTFFACLCGAALLLALGSFTELARVLYDVPGWSFFRIPTRFLAWVGFGGAVLAGLGMDHALGSGRDRYRGRRWTVLMLCAPALAVAAANHQVLFATVADSATWTTIQVSQIWRYRADLWFDLIRCALMLLSGFVLLAWPCRGWRRRAIAPITPLLLFADLFSFGSSFNSLIPVSAYESEPPSATFIKKDISERWSSQAAGEAVPESGLARTVTLVNERNSPYDWHGSWAVDKSSYLHYPGTLRMYTGSLYGLANTLPGWSPLHLKRHWEFTAGHPRFLDLANAGYVVSYHPLDLNSLEPVYEDEVRIYRNTRALPRAYVVPRAVRRESQHVLRYMMSHQFDPRTEVVVETKLQNESDEGSGFFPARVAAYEPQRVEIDLGQHGGGLLVLSDTDYPGWRAFVDGVERPVLTANYVFRAVEVDTAARRVIFEYEPSSYIVGLWFSLAAIASLVVAAILTRHHELPVTASTRDLRVLGTPVALAFIIVVVHGILRSWSQWWGAVERLAVTSVWPLFTV